MVDRPLNRYRVVYKSQVIYDALSRDNEQASRFHRSCPKGATLYRVEQQEGKPDKLIELSTIKQTCAELNAFMASLINSPSGSPDSD